MTQAQIEAIRRATAMRLSPDHANAAGLTLDQLKQFVGGALHLPEPALLALARAMKVVS